MHLEDWLDDLCVRFVVNIPAEELSSVERICFQVEEAQWFYEDFIRPLDPTLPSLTLKPFFHQITQRCPLFREWSSDETNAAFEQFLKYKNRVPVRGAILLNEAMDQVLLVRGFKKGGTWSFPRGKINKDEDDLDCAVREAWEETGFDLKAAGLLNNPNKIRSIEMTMRNQNMKLYIFRGVPTDTLFVPQTRKEIGKIAWYRLADLPTLKKKQGQQDLAGPQLVMNANKFYMVAPFVQPLKKIIAQEKKRDSRIPTHVPLAAFDEPASVLPALSLSKTPQVPSSLPELTQFSDQDPLIGLKQQLNIAPPTAVQSVPAVDHAKSNALLSLLRGGTQSSSTSEPTPDLPLRAAKSRQDPGVSISSHAQNSTVPSGLPDLQPSQRSLLDAFNTQNKVQLPQTQSKTSDLLATFMSSQVPSQPVDIPRPGDTLLGLLRSGQPPVSHNHNHVADSTTSDPAAPSSKIIPTSNPLLGLLTRVPNVAATAGSTSTHSEMAAIVSDAGPAGSPHKPVELASGPAKLQSDSASMKNDLLTLLNESSSAGVSHEETRPDPDRDSTSLNGPALERRGENMTPRSVSERRSQKTPAVESRKLFNPKADEKRIDTPSKLRVKHDTRDQAHGTPRSAKTRVASSPRRPQTQTPKEPVKPFQPQILKRPQSSHSDTPSTLGLPQLESLFSRNSPGDDLSSSDKAASTEQVHSVPLSSPRPSPMQNLTNKPILQLPPPDPQREALLSLLKSPLQDTGPSSPPPPVGKINDSILPAAAASSGFEQAVSPITLVETQQQLQQQLQQIPSEPISRATSLASTAPVIPTLNHNPVTSTGTSSTFAPSARSPVEKRQTAASDKAFLMTYLQKFANQENATPAATT